MTAKSSPDSDCLVRTIPDGSFKRSEHMRRASMINYDIARGRRLRWAQIVGRSLRTCGC